MPLPISGTGRGGGFPAAPAAASNQDVGLRVILSTNPRPVGLFPGMVLTGVLDRSGLSRPSPSHGAAAGTSTAAAEGSADALADGAAVGTSTAAATALVPADGAAVGTSTAAAVSATSIFALIANTLKQSNNNNTATTDPIDTTGADFIVLVAASVVGVASVISDSKGNTWTALTAHDNGSNSRGTIHYCNNPTVGTGHTFTNTCTAGAPAIAVAAYSGADLVTPFDQENGNANTSGTTIATGSITPTVGNELIIVGLTGAWTGTAAVNVGTILNQAAFPGSNAYGIALAHQIQTVATPRDATWSGLSSSEKEALIASFKTAA